MKNLFIIASIILVLLSCGSNEESPKSKLVFFEAKVSDFDKYINRKSTPDEPNLQEDRTIINNDYPIEISLYEDGKWYYNLPNLDDGFGTWEYDGGVIKLHASRTLFDMNITVEAVKEEAKEIAIRFSDRFGPKVLTMEKRNL